MSLALLPRLNPTEWAAVLFGAGVLGVVLLTVLRWALERRRDRLRADDNPHNDDDLDKPISIIDRALDRLTDWVLGKKKD